MEDVRAEDFEKFVEVARNAGATSARLIPARMIVLDERVRLKCEVPRCAGYGQYLTCPPYAMDVAAFAKIRDRYQWGLLVQVEAEGIDSTNKAGGRIDAVVHRENREPHLPFRRRLLEVVEAVEAAAFKKGLRFAAGLVGGSCVLCERCVENKNSDACRNPFRARPAMEGVGIDVVQTARNAGLPLHLSSAENVRWTGLILLD